MSMLTNITPNPFVPPKSGGPSGGQPIVSSASFEFSIPQTTLTADGLDSIFSVPHLCNVTLVNGGSGAVTLSLYDENNFPHVYTINGGAPFTASGCVVKRITLTGVGQVIAGYLTWPERVDASSIQITSAVTVQGSLGRTWTLGNGDVPSRGWTLGSGDVPNRGWTLGATDTLGGTPITVGGGAIDPRQIRALTLADLITAGRNWTLGSGDTPIPYTSGGVAVASKPQTYDTNNNPIASAVGSGNTPIKQDAAGNLQHVPVLQGTTTPITTQAQQYDVNNYPLHTQGGVTSNGGDIAPTATSATILINSNGVYSASFSVPAGKKWLLSGLGVRLSSTTTGGFAGTVTNINVQVKGFGSPFGNDGPYLQSGAFSWDILTTQTGEAWFYNTSQYSGLGTAATFNVVVNAFARDYLFPAPYYFDVQITVSSVSSNGDIIISLLPIGLQEPI